MGSATARNIKLVCAYDGTDFCGFQRQSNGRAVQEVLERNLGRVLGVQVCVQASGRTDSGAHALGQVVSFQTSSSIPSEALCRALNSLLPADVRVVGAEDVNDGFHARYSSRSKRYEYRIWNSPFEDVFLRRFSWCVRQNLSEHAIGRAAAQLVGVHDFGSVEAAGSPRGSSVRNVTELACSREGKLVTVTIAANGFLYKMVRNIVGCLAEVGMGRLSTEDTSRLLEARDRSAGPPTAPAKGLFLVEVEY